MESSVVFGSSLQASAREKKGFFGRKFKNVVEFLRMITLAGQIITDRTLSPKYSSSIILLNAIKILSNVGSTLQITYVRNPDQLRNDRTEIN